MERASLLQDSGWLVSVRFMKPLISRLMHNDDISNLPEILRRNLNESVQPTVVALGGSETGSNLRDKIRQAVGVDLWK